MTDVGVRLNAEMNLRNTQIKRRKIVRDANLNNFDPTARQAIKEFEDWQRKIFKKNYRKGYRFFQPDSIDTPTPRSAREAWGGAYEQDNTEKNKVIAQKIIVAIVAVVLLILTIL
jgi:hypothetical protein